MAKKVKNKREITVQNRKFFLKWLPFNFCDRFCERCVEFQSSCQIYQEDIQFKSQCLLEGKNPNDMKVVFEHIGKIMADTVKMLEENMKKEGIKLTKKDKDKYHEEETIQEKIVENHSLYKMCRSFISKLREFLLIFQNSLQDKPWIVASLQNEIEELSFYSPLIIVKTARFLHSQIKEKKEETKFSRPDSAVSGTLAFCSLITCRKCLENAREFIKGSEIVWVLKINALLKEAQKTEALFKKAFPAVDNFKDKIIFHGK